MSVGSVIDNHKDTEAESDTNEDSENDELSSDSEDGDDDDDGSALSSADGAATDKRFANEVSVSLYSRYSITDYLLSNRSGQT